MKLLAVLGGGAIGVVVVAGLIWVVVMDRPEPAPVESVAPAHDMAGMNHDMAGMDHDMTGMAPMPGMEPQPAPVAPQPNAASAEQITLGSGLYILHCAGCHGANLEGQPNWQVALPDGRMLAPPLNASGHAHMHSDADLLKAVKEGPATLYPDRPIDMPAFAGVLTDDDIRAVIAFIKTSW